MECRPKVLENVGIVGSVWKRAKMCEGLGIKLLRLGSNISAWIMSAKMECVTECNSQPGCWAWLVTIRA